MSYTDDTIIVECAECGAEATGIDAMMSHILDFHIGYSAPEARKYAEIWTEGAHRREDAYAASYAQDRAYERKLDEARGRNEAA